MWNRGNGTEWEMPDEAGDTGCSQMGSTLNTMFGNLDFILQYIAKTIASITSIIITFSFLYSVSESKLSIYDNWTTHSTEELANFSSILCCVTSQVLTSLNWHEIPRGFLLCKVQKIKSVWNIFFHKHLLIIYLLSHPSIHTSIYLIIHIYWAPVICQEL